jgi:hypothetical protein
MKNPILNPQSENPQSENPQSEFRIPHSDNPQSAIRNPQSVPPPAYIRREPEHHEPDYYVEQEDTFSLAPIVQTLKGYGNVIKVSLIAIITLLLIGGLIAYLVAPTHRMASLRFRLDFEGVDKGEYPNGIKFSSAEIVSTPVLSQVFEANDLKRYTSFEAFKNSVFVLESNRDLEMLEREYQAKLSDIKLTPVDRERIEKEFQKKRESMSTSAYALNLVRDEQTVSMPSSLVNKVLNDILATWAQNADQRKGALKYRVPVYSRNIIQKEFIEAEDYIIAVDILRSKINRILENIDSLSKLPGATVMRTGRQRISLAEVRVNLEDVRRFGLEPLMGEIRTYGLLKDPRAATMYLERRLAQTQLDQQEALGKVKTLQAALHQYVQEKGAMMAPESRAGSTTGNGTPFGGGGSVPALIPQFGESFLDRLVEMSNKNNDIKFRQDITEKIIAEGLTNVSLDKEVTYYKDVLTAVKGFGAKASGQSAAATQAAATVKTNAEKALNAILESLDQVNAIYQEISAQNLNPQTVLYTVTNPVTITSQRAVSLASFLLYGLLTLIFFSLALLFGCLVHARFRERPA